MSTRLPVVTGAELVRALARAGFEVRGTKGSHVHLRRESDNRRVTIPVHSGRDIPPGTLKSIMRDAEVDVDQLRRLLK